MACPTSGLRGPSLESLVDLYRGAGLHPVDFILLFIDKGLPLVHFILFEVHGVRLAIAARWLLTPSRKRFTSVW
jgi:hypothetical protein